MALNSQYVTAVSLNEIFLDKTTGLPLANGTITFYKDESRSDLKAIYTLSGSPGSYTYIQIDNPVVLNGNGTPSDGPDTGNNIPLYYFPYDADGQLELYYVVVQDQFGVTQFTRQARPNVASPPVSNNLFYNFARNATFYSWSNSTDYPAIGVGSAISTAYVVDDWSYQQDDASQTIEVSRGTFLPGDNSVPGNPVYYLLYNNTSAGSGVQTYNQFNQSYKSVQTLNSQDVSVSIWVNQFAGTAGQLSITLTQNFGTGGSPSTNITTAILVVPTLVMGEWTQYTGTAFLPSIFGKTLGTNGDDSLIASLNMPLNKVAQIGMSTLQIEPGTSVSAFIEQSNNDTTNRTDTIAFYPTFSTGDGKITLKTVADPTWVMADDGTLGNSASGANHLGLQYQALYELLWNNITNQYAPVVGGRGANAEADFNAAKPIFLTKAVGRALALSGTAAFASTFTTNFAVNNNLLIATGTTGSFYNGMPVTLTTTGTLPAPLAIATTYYVILIDANNIQLATTQANAVAGTEIILTGNGTGTNTVTINYTAWSLGQYFGEQNHSQVLNELVSHSHAFTNTPAKSVGSAQAEFGSNFNALELGTPPNLVTDASGASFAMNNMQPTSFWNVMIKL